MLHYHNKKLVKGRWVTDSMTFVPDRSPDVSPAACYNALSWTDMNGDPPYPWVKLSDPWDPDRRCSHAGSLAGMPPMLMGCGL